MLESAHNQSIRHHLKTAFPGCVVIKYNDASTPGIPDLEVNWMGQTFKFEDKVVRRGEKLRDKFRARQLDMCGDLYRAMSRCFIVTFWERGTDAFACEAPGAITTIHRPDAIDEALTPDRNVDGHTQILHTFARHGVVWANDYRHDLVCSLIYDITEFWRGHAN